MAHLTGGLSVIAPAAPASRCRALAPGRSRPQGDHKDPGGGLVGSAGGTGVATGRPPAAGATSGILMVPYFTRVASWQDARIGKSIPGRCSEIWPVRETSIALLDAMSNVWEEGGLPAPPLSGACTRRSACPNSPSVPTEPYMKRMLCYLMVTAGIAYAYGASSQPARHGASTAACGQTGPLPSACGNIVFDGDSISAGVGAFNGYGLDNQFMGDLRRSARVANVAVGGQPVYVSLQRFDATVTPLFVAGARFNLIVFHAGDNDVAHGRDAHGTYAAFTQYVAKAHQQGWTIIVSTELQRPDFPPDKEAVLDAYNRMLLANTACADSVVNVATDPRLGALAKRSDPTLFSPDHIHPRDAGYAILARMLATAAQSMLGRSVGRRGGVGGLGPCD
jgi:lysophospholipase L1-like esterase